MSALNLFAGRRTFWHPILLVLGIALLGCFFAKVEIQIEGPVGWAGSLPTWRVQHHWLLDIFWGGRPMTGYHAWVFSFMALVFHAPVLIAGRWSWKLEARMLGCVMLFWIVEDLEWFLLNPAYGWDKLSPAEAPWHKHWFLGVPLDYVTFTFVGVLLLWWSFRPPRNSKEELPDATGKTPPADL